MFVHLLDITVPTFELQTRNTKSQTIFQTFSILENHYKGSCGTQMRKMKIYFKHLKIISNSGLLSVQHMGIADLPT